MQTNSIQSTRQVTLQKNEFLTEIKPVGVSYRCEFCNEGEMIFDVKAVMTNQVIIAPNQAPLFPHICTKCNKTMKLQKQYPYIDWIKLEDNNENESTDISKNDNEIKK